MKPQDPTQTQMISKIIKKINIYFKKKSKSSQHKKKMFHKKNPLNFKQNISGFLSTQKHFKKSLRIPKVF